jgi:ankyrin repeat protein
MQAAACALNGQTNVVVLLLAHGAEVNVRDNFGDTPLHEALRWGHKDVAELLRQNGGVDMTGNTTIEYAIQIDDLGAVKVLLNENPALVSSNAVNGWTPLFMAACGGHKDVTELLLANKAKIDAKDITGRTPLHTATEYDHKDVVEVLLGHGADINAKDKNSMMPLHLAALDDHKGVAESLLTHGAEVNAKDNRGRTPLDLASYRGMMAPDKDLLELLRQHGGTNSYPNFFSGFYQRRLSAPGLRHCKLVAWACSQSKSGSSGATDMNL